MSRKLWIPLRSLAFFVVWRFVSLVTAWAHFSPTTPSLATRTLYKTACRASTRQCCLLIPQQGASIMQKQMIACLGNRGEPAATRHLAKATSRIRSTCGWALAVEIFARTSIQTWMRWYAPHQTRKWNQAVYIRHIRSAKLPDCKHLVSRTCRFPLTQ